VMGLLSREKESRSERAGRSTTRPRSAVALDACLLQLFRSLLDALS